MSLTQLRGTQIKDNTVTSGQVDSSIIVAGGGNAFTGDQDMGSHKLTGLASGTNPNDAVNFSQLSNVVSGLNQKPTARLATTAALPAGTYANGTAGVGATFSVTATGTLTIDGTLTALGDILLVKNQASAFQNGLYIVTTAGAGGVAAVLTRHTSMDSSAEFSGAFIPVDNEGATNANTLWLNNYTAGFTVGTTAVTFTQLSSVTTYTGTNGINVTGTVISPTYGTAVNTITQGNDARLSDARTPVGTALTSTNIWVGNGSNLAAAVAMSGDATMSNAGVVTLAATVFRTAKYIVLETPSGTVNGSNVTFTLANTPVSGTVMVFENGIVQEAGSGNDYTISGATITYLAAPLSGDKLRCTYFST